jgi:hypothetical protein
LDSGSQGPDKPVTDHFFGPFGKSIEASRHF